MNGILVDSCILIDIFSENPNWVDWSERMLDAYSQSNTLFINSIIYTEISIGFEKIETLDQILSETGISVLEIPREALFLAGKAFLAYRRHQGKKTTPLPDFFIGAHASVEDFTLITRDIQRYHTYFPKVKLISP